MEILVNNTLARLLALRFWLSALVLGTLMSVVQMSAQGFREEQIKAAFIYNFAQFSDWPADAFQETNSPLIICILGTTAFGETLEQTVRNEKVRGHPVMVKHCETLAEAERCHILYISPSEAGRLEKIVSSLRNKPVLTVSDTEDATRRGLMIGLFIERNRVRFRVNLEAAKMARLTLSSKVVNLAQKNGEK